MAKKDTKGKLRLDFIPIEGLKEVARCREFGENKYPGGGSKSYLKDVKVDDLVVAAWRHCLEHLEGNLKDDESKLLHLSHIATNAMMAIEIIKHQNKKEGLK